jgi:adenosylhomocysteine nucleosidase
MIAVTFALPQESKEFLSTLRNRESDGGIIIGHAGAQKIALGHTGVGGNAATTNVRTLLAAHRPDYLICTGFAGALDGRLRVGDLLVATNYSAPQLVARCRERCRESFRFADDPVQSTAISSVNRRNTPCIFFGSLTSHIAVVETSVAKADLALRTGALGVDMETDAVAAECARISIPLLAMRVISDAASTDLPVPIDHWFDLKLQRPRPFALLAYLARHPGRVLPFGRFVSALPRLRVNLARAILATIT